MWPFGRRVNELAAKADLVAPALLEVCKEVSPSVLSGLLGEDDAARDRELLAAVCLEVLVFALHLTDRLTFSHLGPGKRRLFMNALLPATKRLLQPPFDVHLQDTYNSRQEFYSSCRELFPEEKENLRGTLFWEFGKALAAVYAGNNPVAVTMTSMSGMGLLPVIEELLRSTEVIGG